MGWKRVYFQATLILSIRMRMTNQSRIRIRREGRRFPRVPPARAHKCDGIRRAVSRLLCSLHPPRAVNTRFSSPLAYAMFARKRRTIQPSDVGLQFLWMYTSTHTSCRHTSPAVRSKICQPKLNQPGHASLSPFSEPGAAPNDNRQQGRTEQQQAYLLVTVGLASAQARAHMRRVPYAGYV